MVGVGIISYKALWTVQNETLQFLFQILSMATRCPLCWESRSAESSGGPPTILIINTLIFAYSPLFQQLFGDFK